MRSGERVMGGSLCIIGLVVERIIEDIFHNIRIEDLIFAVLNWCKYFGMLERVFLIFKHNWIIG